MHKTPPWSRKPPRAPARPIPAALCTAPEEARHVEELVSLSMRFQRTKCRRLGRAVHVASAGLGTARPLPTPHATVARRNAPLPTRSAPRSHRALFAGKTHGSSSPHATCGGRGRRRGRFLRRTCAPFWGPRTGGPFWLRKRTFARGQIFLLLCVVAPPRRASVHGGAPSVRGPSFVRTPRATCARAIVASDQPSR